MSKIITVCGAIEPKALGYTSMHDHTYVNANTFYKFMVGAIPGGIKEMLSSKEKQKSRRKVVVEQRKKLLNHLSIRPAEWWDTFLCQNQIQPALCARKNII